MMLVISRRRRSPRLEEIGRTKTDVIDDKERQAKKVDGKDEVKLRRRRTRRR